MKTTAVNLTGEKAGVWIAIRPTGETDTVTTSKIWLIRCENCGVERHVSLSVFRAYQRQNRGYRCSCMTDFSLKRPKPVVERAERSAEPRKQSRVCDRCAGLSWRVVGPKCRDCGLRFQDLPPVELEFRSGVSQMQQCIDRGIGAMGGFK